MGVGVCSHTNTFHEHVDSTFPSSAFYCPFAIFLLLCLFDLDSVAQPWCTLQTSEDLVKIPDALAPHQSN